MPDRNDFYEKLHHALEELRIPDSRGRSALTYGEYVTLPDEMRGDDERDVVDRLLTPRILECLDYNEEDWHYNREKGSGRPDFVIRVQGKTAFFWENKRTSLDPDPESEQIRRYAESITQIGLLFNGKEIVAFRREQKGLVTFLRVNLMAAYKLGAPVLDFIHEDAVEKLELFYELFKKGRFSGFGQRLQALLISEETWKSQARPIKTHLQTFVEEIQGTIERLARMAHSTLEFSSKKFKKYEIQLQTQRSKWNEYLEKAKNDLASQIDAQMFLFNGQGLAFKLGEIQDHELQSLSSQLRNKPSQWRMLEKLRQLNDEARELRILYESYRSVHTRYAQWIELQRHFEEGSGIAEEGEGEQELEFNRSKRFSRQSAYVFFLKLLLIRVLEDKGIVAPRLISDGGLEAWIEAVRPRYAVEESRFAASHLLRMALERAASHYGELLRRETYDWFMPDDLSIFDALEVLANFDFSKLATDLIGYTYQRFLERTERHRLGHYLTPPEVVDYILDEAGYSPDNREIIGKKILDPACGSGSFLVHAAYRYRQALEAYYREQNDSSEESRLSLAKDFLRSIQENFVGVDLNSFSCYLARINLLIQALDDYHFLQSQMQDIPIEGFRIYNDDSLVGFQGAELAEELSEIRHLKTKEAGQFGFVFANPPYITPKQEDIGIAILRQEPFYESWLSGDLNTYILFIRVGLHFLASDGCLAYIVPLTSMGDQQSEALRRKLLTMTKPKAITRFYTEHVLFRGVDQAVTVLILEKDAIEARRSLKTRVRGGGFGQNPGEAIHDTRTRRTLVVPFRNLSWWISKQSKPRRGIKVPNQREQWENVWTVFPEDRDYCRLWKWLVDASSQTLYQLLEELGIKPPEDFISQGDVNTTHVIPFHVAADHEEAMPLYKGELIDLLMPLPCPPDRGPKGRSPFVAPLGRKGLSREQVRALAQLQRIDQLKESEYGIVLHETAKTRVQRRLKGTLFHRSHEFKPVFTHKLWVFRVPEPNLAKALLGLLISTPLNFSYAALSTNNSIATRLLFCLPMHNDFEAIAHVLEREVDSALNASGKLQDLLKAYGGKPDIDSSYTKGRVELDPISVLQKEKLATAKMKHYQQRGYLTLASQSFKMQTLLERGNLTIEDRPFLQDVLHLWIERYGDCRWGEFQELPVPDDPKAFWKQWLKKSEEAEGHLEDYFEAIQTLDETVADRYNIPSDLRHLLRERLPWTHGAQHNNVTNENGEEV